MDPNATLELIREAIEEIKADNPTDRELDFIEAFENLDNWIKDGGFLPDDWADDDDD